METKQPVFLQVAPDWSEALTAGQMQAQLVGFEFKGPGLYLSDSDTMLVLSGEPEVHQWACSNSPDKLWRVFVWNVEGNQTICALIEDVPVRADTRK